MNNVVSRGLYEQIKWERDIALEQLESYGVSLGSNAEVVKVVHGRWERTDKYDEDSDVRCSRCKMEFDYIDGMCYLVEGVELPNYCPNCGADMRGNDNGNC